MSLAHTRTPLVSSFVCRHVALVAMHCIDIAVPSLLTVSKENGLVGIQIVQVQNYVILLRIIFCPLYKEFLRQATVPLTNAVNMGCIQK